MICVPFLTSQGPGVFTPRLTENAGVKPVFFSTIKKRKLPVKSAVAKLTMKMFVMFLMCLFGRTTIKIRMLPQNAIKNTGT